MSLKARMLLSLFAPMAMSDIGIGRKKSKSNDSKLPLTDEEKEKLRSLVGKEKKKFIKELKEKYSEV